MADITIPQLNAATSVSGTDVMVISQAGVTKKVEVDKLTEKVLSSSVDVLHMNPTTVQTLANIGELAFNPDTQTLEVKCSADVTLSIGQENYIRGKNAESSTILNGTVVYVSGGLGANSLIKRAGNANGTAERVIGVATQDIGANNIGFITTSGIVNKLNTSAYAEGTLLWLGTNGAMTNVKPNTSADQICIGVVLRAHATQGSILVSVKDDWRDKLAEVRSEVSDNEYSLNNLSLNGRLMGRVYTNTPQPANPSYGDIYLVMSNNVWGTTSSKGQYLLYNGTEFVVKYLYELKPSRWHSNIKSTYYLQYGWDKILNCIWDAKVFYPNKTDAETKYILNHVYLVSNKINFMKLFDYDPITDTYGHMNLPDISFDWTSQKGVKTVRFLLENEIYCDLTIDFDSILAITGSVLYDYHFSMDKNSLLRNTYFTNIGYYAGSESGASYISHYIAAQNYTGTAFEEKCTGTADQIIINQHILAASQAGGGTVELSAGNFYINDSIVMHPNVTLKCDKRSVIKLVNGARKYMLTNHNYVSGLGTSNITVDGGIWNGNKSGGQPRDYTGNPLQTYWGFGFFFKEVNNLKITNMRIEQTEAWGIAPFRVKKAVFDNIEFQQYPIIGANGDGISGSSWQDVLINNIYGYTNDDMIGVANSNYFGGGLGGHLIFWEDEGFISNNIRITNLNLQKHPVSGIYAHRAIGIYATEDTVIDNLYIDGVTGGWGAYAYAIGIIQYWSTATEFNGVGYLGKVVIKNVDLESPDTSPTLVQVSNSPGNIVDDLSVDNLTLRCNTESNSTILSVGTGCKNIHAANITGINKSTGTVYPVNIGETSLIPINLNLTGVDKRDGVGNILFSRVSAGLLRINSTHNVDKSIITNPKSGDMVVDLDGKPYVYYNSQWNAIF